VDGEVLLNTFAINGNWIEDPAHTFRSQALQFGAGIFETIRVQGGAPLMWDAHLERLCNSARILGMDEGLDAQKLDNWTARLLSACGMDRCALKLLWVPGGGGGQAAFYFRPLEYTPLQRETGMRAGIGTIRRNPFSHITAHKTCNYLDNLLERECAKAAGMDEFLLLNIWDQVSEGTASNVFVQIEGQLFTPPVETGLLPGLMRRAILESCGKIGISTGERLLTVEDLASAEGIYLTNSLMGFMPVSYFMGNCYDVKGPMVSEINAIIGLEE